MWLFESNTEAQNYTQKKDKNKNPVDDAQTSVTIVSISLFRLLKSVEVYTFHTNI